ncbi:MAG: transglycosylase domain-containing protein [Candidatus Pacebacteria bacterium]|nr:transglycosylase domain-containing protein [Candidatus Paceibacterota bacterium]MDD5545100.1 transglycosylase domain-containing protein [Candidatus Paceibacterota bacterium]
MTGKTKKVFLAFIILFLLTLVAGIGAFFFLSKGLPDPRTFNERVVAQSTKIYDRTGKILLYEMHGGEKRTVVSLNEISPSVIKCVLAAEDDTFYQHKGFVLKGMARAFIKNLLNPKELQGGSTITQQLARNAFLTSQKSVIRKIKEAILTVKIEQNYDKDQILEMYLNQINFGHNNYGIENASNFYFNKSAKDLTLAEAAYLISLIQSPNYLSPYGNHLDELEARKNWVLSRLEKLNYYPKNQVAEARQEKVNFALQNLGLKAPHFVMYVRDILYKKFSEEELENGGYTIITTLDMRLQELAEKVIEKYGDFNEKKVGAKNLALLAQDPKTGQILAMVGSRDYWNMEAEGNVNATLSIRQPGSSFKPIVYATAFKKGFLPESVIFDVALNGVAANFSTDPNNPYFVRNYDEKTRGPVTFRQALAQSLNIPSVKVLYLAGIKESIQTAKDLGITTLNEPPSHYGLSLVLGGGGVKLIEMVNAYSVFSQEGVYHPQNTILQIKDSNGKNLEEFKIEEKKVLDPQIARLINSILSDNASRAPTFGWNNPLYFQNFQAAAKTGTDSEYRDAWTLGYTTSLTSGVWAGNNDRSPVAESGAPGSMVAAPCWHEFMEKASQYYPPENFVEPLPYDPKSINIPMVNGDYVNVKKYKNNNTGEIKEFKEIHNILYYIDKNNIFGQTPIEPSLDSQFWNWEIPVLLWAQQNIPNFNQEFNQLPSSEYTPLNENQKDVVIEFPDTPKIEFLNPANGNFISGDFNLEVSINTPLALNKTEVYLNKKFIGNLLPDSAGHYYLTIKFADLDDQNEIKIEAEDSLNQKSSASIIIFKQL